MDRKGCVPVGQPANADGIENGRLSNRSSVCLRGDLEFEPSPSRHLPFGREHQAPRGLDRVDAPPVDRIANAQQLRMRASTPHTNTADQQVQEPAYTPKPVRVIPTVLATNLGNRGKRLLWRYRHLDRAGIDEPISKPSAGP